MKFAWFTPFDHTSAIGAISNIVCEELIKQGHEVVIYAAKGEKFRETNVPFSEYTSDTLNIDMLKEYDHVLYNLGNYGLFHHEIYKTLVKFPGKVILHDRTLNGFFRQLYKEEDCGGNLDKGYTLFCKAMEECYGTEGLKKATELYHFDTETDEIMGLMSEYTLLPKALRKATGVFTHANSFLKELADDYLGPMDYAYLPCETKSSEGAGEVSEEIRKKFKSNGKLLVISNGLIHKIKRNHIMAEVLAENPQIAAKLNFVLIGSYGGEYGERLKKMSENELENCMYLLGYQPNDIMESFLQQADIAVNLRYPNSEVCSLSLLEHMSYGKPVIATNSGIFGELPNDAVIKIELEDEKEQLKAALMRLIDDQKLREKTGTNARKFVRDNCAVENYVSRLLHFLKSCETINKENELVNKILNRAGKTLGFLNVKETQIPSSVFHVQKEYEALLGDSKCEKTSQFKTVGIWFGFSYYIQNLSREGISRFMGCLVTALLECYPLDMEIWCYDENLDEIQIIFEAILKEPSLRNRVRFITEKNYKEILGINDSRKYLSWETLPKEVRLGYIAREFSFADVFVPAIIYLDNVVLTDKPIIVPAHDMAVAYHYNDFVGRDETYISRCRDIIDRANNLARVGAKLVSASEFVRKEHILNNIPCSREEKTFVIPFPVFMSERVQDEILSERELRERFRLTDPYLFYPSQIRPHKNVGRLLEAFSIVRESMPKLKLVLTGDVKDVLETYEKLKKLNLENAVVMLKNVAENELFSLYHYCSAVVVPTTMEANFPTQATEALACDRPLVLSEIPVVLERIGNVCEDNEACGLQLFDPCDTKDLADKIKFVLQNEKEVIRLQKEFREKLLRYTWNDAAQAYYKLMDDAIREQTKTVDLAQGER